jgi:hypothetical protein
MEKIDDAGLVKRNARNFVLDEQKLRRIVAVLNEYVVKLREPHHVYFYIEREDEAYWETRTVEAILTDDNAPPRGVQALTINIIRDELPAMLRREGEQYAAQLRFARNQDHRVAYSIGYPDRDWCFLLGDELEAQIQRCLKPRPLRFFTEQYVDVAFGILLFVALITVFTAVSANKLPLFTVPQIHAMSVDQRTEQLLQLAVQRDTQAPWTFVVLMLLVGLIFGVAAASPVSRFFKRLDRSVFYWGDAAVIYERLQSRLTWLKWGVVVAFVVSVVGSVVASFLTRH